jgi:hypothetical protein
MKDKQLEALIRKATGKTGTGQGPKNRFIDPTLKATAPPEDEAKAERERLFKEMKRREF